MKYLLHLAFPIEQQLLPGSAGEKCSAGQPANSVATPAQISSLFSFRAPPQLHLLEATAKLALCQRLSKAIIKAETQQQRALLINALSQAVSQCKNMPITLCLQSTGAQPEDLQLSLPAGQLAEFFCTISNLNSNTLDSPNEEFKEASEVAKEHAWNTTAPFQIHPAFYACIESNEEFIASLQEQRASYEARCLCEAESSIFMAKQDAMWTLRRQIRILFDQLLQNIDKNMEHSLGATILDLQWVIYLT